MLNTCLSLLLIFCSAWPVPHNFHTALAEMQHNAKFKRMEVSLRVFTDDLLKGINGQGLPAPDMDMGRAEVPPSVEKYLQNQFILTGVNSAKLPMKMIGHEIDQDVTWLYFEIALGDLQPSEVTVDFRLLTGIYTDQSNILNYKGIDESKTILFRTGETSKGLLSDE